MKYITIYGTGSDKQLLIGALAHLAMDGKICETADIFDHAGDEQPMIVYKQTVPYGAILYKTHGRGLCAFINRIDGEVEIAAEEGVSHDDVEQFFDVILKLAAPMQREEVLDWILEGMKAMSAADQPTKH